MGQLELLEAHTKAEDLETVAENFKKRAGISSADFQSYLETLLMLILKDCGSAARLNAALIGSRLGCRKVLFEILGNYLQDLDEQATEEELDVLVSEVRPSDADLNIVLEGPFGIGVRSTFGEWMLDRRMDPLRAEVVRGCWSVFQLPIFEFPEFGKFIKKFL